MMENWIESLPETLQANPSLSKFESPADLAKSYVELESFRGRSIAIPGEDASEGDRKQFYQTVMERVPGLVRKPVEDDPESHDNFWKSMGRPEDIDGYSEIDGMTPEQTEAMRQAAFDSNMTQEQYRKFAEKMTDRVTQERSELEFQRNQERDAIFHEWGVAKDQKLQAIRQVAAQLQMDESLMDFDDPRVLRLMNTFVEKVGSEGSQMQHQIGENGVNVMTPAEADAKITEIMNNKEHAFWHSDNPGHEAAKRKVIELETLVNPGASTSMASQRSGFGNVQARDTIF